MAANTPLRRYKQNTHGGGIRDPLTVYWPDELDGDRMGDDLRHQFAHASNLTPTILELIGQEAPTEINGIRQMPLEGASFAASLTQPDAPPKTALQYFEVSGHRGLWHGGWKDVAFHPPGSAFDDDEWELYHLDEDFSETRNLAGNYPEKLKDLVDIL